ncbi:MAG: electron transfer flavoprotein subunit alpha/FixB family protein [Desulfomonile sp.]
MKPSIALIAEHCDGALSPTFFELVTFANKLKDATQAKPIILVLGHEIAEAANQASRSTDLDVVAITVPGLVSYNPETCKTVLGAVLEELKPAHICAVHTPNGSDLAPSLSVKLSAACITSVEEVRIESGRVKFLRSVLGGKAQAIFSSNTDITVVTIQPGCFKRADVCAYSGNVKFIHMEYSPKRIQNLGVRPGPGCDALLSEAKVIISAGRGVRQKENLDTLFELAGMFARSAVGCTRPLSDSGQLSSRRQVGLSGAIVSPDLYIACGISGAQQHIVGMQGSGFVVGINTDSNAPIFNHSDICVVADIDEFARELIKAIAIYRRTPPNLVPR